MKFKKQAQSLIEYALIMALVALVAVIAMNKFSNPINNVGKQATSAVNNSGDTTLKDYCKSVNKSYSSGTKCN